MARPVSNLFRILPVAAIAALGPAGWSDAARGWEIGDPVGAAPSIVEEYLGSELRGVAAGFELIAAGAPGFRPDSLVVHDYVRDCKPQQRSSFSNSIALGSPCLGEDRSVGPARRIAVERDVPLALSTLEMVLGDAAAAKNAGEADLSRADPQAALDNTPLFAPDVGPTKWRTVLFSVGAITRLGPGELKNKPRRRSRSDFIGALMRPIAVAAFVVLFGFLAIAIFRVNGQQQTPESATRQPYFKTNRVGAFGKPALGGERMLDEPARQFVEPHPLEGYGAMEADARVAGGLYRGDPQPH